MRLARILTMVILLLLSTVANATTETVTVTGYGATVDAATKNAWQVAISQVVGTIIDSTVVVENDQLIKDEVLAFSKGFIQKYDVVGQSSQNGLIAIEIKAVVTTEQLENKLVEIGVHSVDVDGGSLGV